nr:hypothetical protein [uncultured Mediterranean phage uvMED]
MGKLVLYDEDALWTEIERILEEDQERQFTPGQQCYHNLVHCANPAYFLTGSTTIALEEFMTMKRFNIPPAKDIDSANYNRLVIYSAIDEEYNAAIKLESNG